MDAKITDKIIAADQGYQLPNSQKFFDFLHFPPNKNPKILPKIFLAYAFMQVSRFGYGN